MAGTWIRLLIESKMTLVTRFCPCVPTQASAGHRNTGARQDPIVVPLWSPVQLCKVD